MIDEFYTQISKLKGVEIEKNANVKKDSNLRINSIFLYKIEISNVCAIKKVFRYLKEYSIKYYIIGKGSNVLFLKHYYNGALIKLMPSKSKYLSIVNAGDSLAYVNDKFIKNGIDTLTFLSAVPCSIGGAIYMNAGAFDKEIKDIVEYVYAYDIDKDKFIVLNNEECRFNYRDSFFKHTHLLIIGAKIKIEYLDKNKIFKKYRKYLKLRLDKMPLEYSNIGSIFKNPPGLSAGKLIESTGLKGLVVGGAKISEKHANIIINFDNASGKDVLRLIEIIKREIYFKHKIMLELEIIIFK